MRTPLLFPPPNYVRQLDTSAARTIHALCASAGIPCRATGNWILRPIVLSPSNDLSIDAEPGYCGAVRITTPPDLSDRDTARFALCVLAYGLHDLVARQSVAGHAWARPSLPPGRPMTGRALSAAERQRRFRQRHARRA